MSETFTLEIELGNDAMQDGDDVANELDHLGQQLREGYTSGIVIASDGQRVGRWAIA